MDWMRSNKKPRSDSINLPFCRTAKHIVQLYLCKLRRTKLVSETFQLYSIYFSIFHCMPRWSSISSMVVDLRSLKSLF